jgi:hypothetical protein
VRQRSSSLYLAVVVAASSGQCGVEDERKEQRKARGSCAENTVACGGWLRRPKGNLSRHESCSQLLVAGLACSTHTHGTRSVMTRLVRSCGRHLPAGYSGLKSAMFAARECLGECNGDWKYGDEAAEDD